MPTDLTKLFTKMPADPPKPGVYENIAEADYHRVRAWSQTTLKLVGEWDQHGQTVVPGPHRSPAHVKAHLSGDVDDATEAKEFGSAYHVLLMEPDRFAREFVTLSEKLDRRRKDDKAFYDAAIEKYGEDRVLPADRWKVLQEMALAAAAHPLAKSILRSPGRSEVTGVFKHPLAKSLPCKMRIDRVTTNTNKRPVLIDLKTTRCAHPRMFERDAARYGYHVQAAFYCDGWTSLTGDVPDYVIVAQEKEPPHPVCVYRFSGDAIDAGRLVYQAALRELERCVAADQWPAYADAIVPLSLPTWAQAVEEAFA